MRGTIIYPVEGYITCWSQDNLPGVLSGSEKTILRELAKKVAAIAAKPKQQERKRLWYKHCQLEKVRPMLLVLPENSWIEFVGEDQLQLKDPFWQQWEWYLRHVIYRDENIDDDLVIQPTLYVKTIFRRGKWGLEGKVYQSDDKESFTSYRWDGTIQNPDDLKKLKHRDFEVDKEATQKHIEALEDMFGDLFEVKESCEPPSVLLADTAAGLRGIEQLMWDMCDRPQWVHELMDFISEGVLKEAKYLQDNGYLTLNNCGHYTDTGGIGFTNELPAKGFDGKNVRLSDLWGYGAAQVLSDVSPQMHEEFILQYDVRILKHYGINSYGCCEPYTNKFDIVKKNVPNLRRVSVSPWCDMEKAAEALEDKYIYSCKPNPSMLVGEFRPDEIRDHIRQRLEAAKGCVLEIILKDIMTVENQPQRLINWTRIAREEIEKVSS